MKEDVADCFRRIIQNRKHPKIEPMIDGYSGFLFLDKNDMPIQRRYSTSWGIRIYQSH